MTHKPVMKKPNIDHYDRVMLQAAHGPSLVAVRSRTDKLTRITIEESGNISRSLTVPDEGIAYFLKTVVQLQKGKK
jgi:hypothetical protein